VLTAARDSGTLAYSYAVALETGIFVQTGNLSAQNVYDWASRAKTKEFGERVTKHQLYAKLDAKAPAGQNADDVAASNQFNVVRASYAAEKRTVGVKYDDFLEALAKLVEQTKLAKAEAITTVEGKFGVIAEYEGPTELELAQSCWTKFCAAATASGAQAPIENDDNFRLANEGFSTAVRSEHLAHYLRDNTRKAALLALSEREIGNFTNSFRIKQANKIQTLMDTLNGVTAGQSARITAAIDPGATPGGVVLRMPTADAAGSIRPVGRATRRTRSRSPRDHDSDEEERSSRRHRSDRRRSRSRA
jgi:hypothetical protein